MDKVKFFRNRLDKLDESIALNTARKIDVVLEFWKWKKENNISLIDKKREKNMVELNSRKSGLRKDFLKQIYKDIRNEVKKQWKS